MKQGLVFGLFVCVIFGGSFSVFAAECVGRDNVVLNDGGCWNSISRADKNAVMRGIWVGLETRRLGNELVGQSSSDLLSFDHTTAPNETTMGDLTKYFDKLYSYPVNRRILWPYAYLLAVLNARDDDSNDRLALVRFLRDYGSLPLGGSLAKVISVNTIMVKTRTGELHKVKLAGVASDGTSAEVQSTALNLLAKLQHARYGKCQTDNDEGPVTVSLRYKDQFFDSDNVLSAYVAIYGGHICKDGEAVSLQSIWDGINTFELNSLLLRNGLAKAVKETDPAWTKERRRIREWNTEWGEKRAKDQKMYSFGNIKNPWIELVVSPTLQGAH